MVLNYITSIILACAHIFMYVCVCVCIYKYTHTHTYEPLPDIFLMILQRPSSNCFSDLFLYLIKLKSMIIKYIIHAVD